MFSFEAGRRCDSGPGNFTFETKQGNEIFMLVDQAIQSQKAQTQDQHLSCSSLDPDCPSSLQQIRNAMLMGGSGDSSGNSREADGDSGGSKPGSGDGVLGKRESGEGGGGGVGRGQGQGGLKCRSLPEPPGMLGVMGEGLTPPRSPRGQTAAKGVSSAEQAHLYSEPADAVRLPLYNLDCIYSDPVDSFKIQNQTSVPANAPVPVPRLRTPGDEAAAGGGQGEQFHGGVNRKPPDLFSHVYDQITLELMHKTNVLSLNGGTGGGKGEGRKVKNKKNPPGGQAEGATLSPLPCQEHIYDEPEGCASLPAGLGMSIYSEARLEPHSQMRLEEVGPSSGSQGHYTTPSQGKSADSQMPQHLGPNRSNLQTLVSKYSKPVLAPKPGRKEPMPLPPGKQGGNVNNNNNNKWVEGGSGVKELYSRVIKQKPLPADSWYGHHRKVPLRSPEIIYDNLGDV